MNRVTIALDDELLAEVDRIVKTRGYQNRSEAIRDLARGGLRQAAENSRGERGLRRGAGLYLRPSYPRFAQRLVQTFHDHHDLSVSTLHVHLDHDSCLEVNVLRGKSRDMQHLADHVIAERGIHHGRVVMFRRK